MKILDIKEKTPEWYSLRHEKIGASDVPIILGVSHFKTRDELLMEKTHKLKSEISPWLADRAKESEQRAIAYIELVHNISIKKICVQSEDIPYLMSSLDGYDSNNKIVYEIKMYGKRDADLLRLSKLPERFNMQVQTQLYVTKANYACLVLSGPIEKTLMIRVQTDYEIINSKIIPAVRAFYFDMKQERKKQNEKI